MVFCPQIIRKCTYLHVLVHTIYNNILTALVPSKIQHPLVPSKIQHPLQSRDASTNQPPKSSTHWQITWTNLLLPKGAPKLKTKQINKRLLISIIDLKLPLGKSIFVLSHFNASRTISITCITTWSMYQQSSPAISIPSTQTVQTETFPAYYN